MTGTTPQVDDRLVEQVRSSLAATASTPTPARVASALRTAGAMLGDAAVLEITDQLRSEITGVGPLQPLVRDPDVTDVLVNGPGDVWVDRGRGLERTSVRFRDTAAVRRLAQRLAAAAGRRLDDAVPFVDARIAGGIRLHAVLPPVAPDGPLVSLRVPAGARFGIDDLVHTGSVPPAMVPWLQAIVSARLAFLVTGGTGSGKTTVLGALLSTCAPDQRIVLVEDSGELRPDHPHVVRLEARAANVEGAGRIGLDDLVRQALRMRPDRLVVGEVRGAEVVDLLAALNTGHEGGCGTLHANSAADVPARLEALGIAAGLGRAAVHAQAGTAIDTIMHVDRDRTGQRRLAAIHVVVTGADGTMHTSPALRYDGENLIEDAGLDRLVGGLADRGWSP